MLREEISVELNKSKEFIYSGEYDLIILDEVLGAIEYGFIKEEEILNIMDNK